MLFSFHMGCYKRKIDCRYHFKDAIKVAAEAIFKLGLGKRFLNLLR